MLDVMKMLAVWGIGKLGEKGSVKRSVKRMLAGRGIGTLDVMKMLDVQEIGMPDVKRMLDVQGMPDVKRVGMPGVKYQGRNPPDSPCPSSTVPTQQSQGSP
jgi:hypothetical protein